ncbi:MAG: TolB family protein [Nitrospirota bacterium]
MAWSLLFCALPACQSIGPTSALFGSASGVSRQITFTPYDDFAPAWTRDGRSLIYVSIQQDGWNLWSIDLSTPTPRALTAGRFQYTGPFATADGRWIAVSSDSGSDEPKWPDLWLLAPDGTQQQRLTAFTPTIKEFMPVISGDGRWLAYLDLPMNRPPQYRLMLVELPTGLPRVLTEDHVVFSQIRISPDNRSILYTADTLGSADVWTIGIDGAGARALTARPGSDIAGDYSPDGTHIVFVSNQSGVDELWTMNPQGLGARQLTHDLATASLPAFSPDGAHIAYTSTKSGNPDIWVIGTGATRDH